MLSYGSEGLDLWSISHNKSLDTIWDVMVGMDATLPCYGRMGFANRTDICASFPLRHLGFSQRLFCFLFVGYHFPLLDVTVEVFGLIGLGHSHSAR